MTNIDKLYEAVELNGNVCVGLDTDYSYLPDNYRQENESKGGAIFRFNKEIIEATRTNAACYKVQIAYYESLGLDGMQCYASTLKYLRENNLLVIADIKRGDIAKTAEMYAKAHFEGDFEADFITLSPYMGMDSIDLVGDKVAELGDKYIGKYGYSSLGCVIGGTHIEETKEIRNKYKHSFFLIPGYGAQGGKAEDIAQYLINGNGGVVNASRSILLAYKKQSGVHFAKAAYNECVNMREAIARECKALKV
ncbi:MAG: orotidine-5'-phosphate decarboxylase [Oscillospiraceae bacterium]